MKFLRMATVIGTALAFAVPSHLALAESPSSQTDEPAGAASASSPQKAKTGVGKSAGNAAGGLFTGSLTTSNLITGVVVLTAVGVAVAAATDDEESPTTTTTTTGTN